MWCKTYAKTLQTFFANYLGAPLFVFDFVAYKVSRLNEDSASHSVIADTSG